MSEKMAKRVRRLEGKVDDLERFKSAWDAAEASAHSQAVQLDAAAERNMERRRARRAEMQARRWQILTGAALVISILVEIAAICCINAKAFRETQNAEPISMADSGRLPGDDIQAMEPTVIYDEEAALIARANVVRDCTVTHYDACVKCCGKTDGITASGAKLIPGVTVAVDPKVIPLGSIVLIDWGDGRGLQRCLAQDVGSAIRGNRIDLACASHDDAVAAGVKAATVYWIPGGAI